MNPLVIIAAASGIVLASCGGGPNPVPQSVTSRTTANRTYSDEVRGQPLPGKQYPVAQLVPDQPGFVISPYTQQPIDRRRLKKGPLVEDPTVHLAVRYFLLPEGF